MNKWPLFSLLLLLLIGCESESSITLNATTSPSATMMAATEQPTVTAAETMSINDITMIMTTTDSVKESVVAGLMLQRAQIAVKQYDDIDFSFSYPADWVVIEGADHITITQSLTDVNEIRPSLIYLETIEDEPIQFELISEGLLSSTTSRAISDDLQAEPDIVDSSEQSSANLFGETYIEWRRAIFQSDRLILLTGECDIVNRAQCERIFGNVVNSMTR